MSVILAACTAGPVATSVDQLPDGPRHKAPEALWQALADHQSRPIVVALAARASADRDGWAAVKRSFVEVPELEVEQTWDELPLVQVRAASLDAALELVDRDEVEAAYDVEQFELTDAESFPLIDQPAALAAGKTGDGTAVAVLDTGTDYTRADFGSCTAPGVPASCKVAYAHDFAPDDGSRDDNGHGTNVAGITVGVAPGTKILALDVFTGSSASSTDIISAINWAVANKATYNIAALNLSLGGGASTTPCAADPMGIALGTARNAGIAPVVASGNNGYTNAISSPGCAPAAISVGAVYDSNVGGIGYSTCSDPTTAADQITCFSNSASFLTVLAPGALITAAGYTMAGTSQATPHVAGTMAILRGAFPTETVDQQVARLTSTGKPIKDPRNSVTVSRIDVFAALGAPPADTTPPTGGVSINGGVAATKTAAVTLAITGSDASGVGQMCVTSGTACTTFEAFAVTRAFTLPAGDGKKTVTVVLRDRAGNTTSFATSPAASIVLDATAPTNGTVTAVPGNASVTLTWTGFADATSGVASYRVAGGTTAPTSCTGTTVYAGSATSVTVGGLTNGTTYSYRVCAVDAAGNLSTGATASAAPRPESNPPVGTLAINAGAATTRTLAVTLTLAATDDTKVAQMCIGDGASCTAFVAYVATAAYTFAAGDGTRTLHAWFRDSWGNTSAPVSASIQVDTIAPSNPTLSASGAPSSIALGWTAASDATSGVAGYRLVGATGTVAPAAGCASGTLLSSGPALGFGHAVAAKATWSYRVCAVDVAGNVGAGTTKTATASN